MKIAYYLLVERGLPQDPVPQRAESQSHLTYYFPRRTDLVAALAARFLELVAQALASSDEPGGPSAPAPVIEALARIITDAGHMRIFLSLLLEAEQDETLRSLLLEHMAEFSALVARRLGRPAGDPDVDLLLTMLRGLGLQSLLQRGAALPETQDLVGRFGFGSRQGGESWTD